MRRDGQASSLAAVGVGSNLDDPATQVDRAIEAVSGIPGAELVGRSSLYRSAPLCGMEQPGFVNAVVTLRTSLGARQLLEALQAIERRMGRVRGTRWGPRIIDLDLLVHGDAEVDEPGLRIPHAGIAARNFVLLPLREIAPDLEIPGLGRVGDLPVDESEPRISRIED